MKKTIFVLLLVILLGACTPAATPIPTNTPVPPTAPPPTATKAPTSTPVPPTSTPLPPTITPSPTVPPPTATKGPTNTPLPTKDSLTLAADVDALLKNFNELNLFHGAVLVAQNGKVILSKGYGMADREKKTPNTPQTRYLLASITKIFTATAVMLLQEQGKLKVQDSICTYLKDCPTAWQAVTIHHLLTHTSGIPDTCGQYTTTDLTSPQVAEEEINAAMGKSFDYAPGEKSVYNSLDYLLLGKIIESASMQKYEAFLKAYIFAPLGMTNTGLYNNQGGIATGYYKDAVGKSLNMWSCFPGAGLYSTVEDLYRFDQALFSAKLVPQKALDTMMIAHVKESGLYWDGYGYGLMVSIVKPLVMGHMGMLISGFSGVFSRYPESKVTVIVLSNNVADPGVMSDMIAKELFP